MGLVLATIAVVTTGFMAWGAGSLLALEYLAWLGGAAEDEDR